MEKKSSYSIIFCEVNPPEALCRSVLSRIAYARVRKLRHSLYLQLSLCFVSGMLFVFLVRTLLRELHTSGFFEYASLIFSSDAGALSSVGRELLYSLVESLPALALLCTLGIAALTVWSLRQIILNRKALPHASIQFLWR